jgi:prepilin-type processing-associated H-X9-DG protein
VREPGILASGFAAVRLALDGVATATQAGVLMANYTIIGGDQKQYPFVTEDNIRSWIAEGRLNAQSLVKADADAEFRPLAEFPEFADALAARTAPEAVSAAYAAEAGATAKTSGLAIASLVLAILGPLACGLTALIGLILGIIALVKIKNSGGALRGRGLALAGVIVSALFLLLTPALLLPALAKAKQKAQTISCANNVMQLAIAMRIYTTDNQDRFPAATNWCDTLQSQAGMTNVFRCPADTRVARCSYAFNARLAGAEVEKVNPRAVMIFEANGGWNVSGGKELLLASPRHGRITVVGFADGHVEQVPESRLPQLRWEL